MKLHPPQLIDESLREEIFGRIRVALPLDFSIVTAYARPPVGNSEARYHAVVHVVVTEPAERYLAIREHDVRRLRHWEGNINPTGEDLRTEGRRNICFQFDYLAKVACEGSSIAAAYSPFVEPLVLNAKLAQALSRFAEACQIQSDVLAAEAGALQLRLSMGAVNALSPGARRRPDENVLECLAADLITKRLLNNEALSSIPGNVARAMYATVSEGNGVLQTWLQIEPEPGKTYERVMVSDHANNAMRRELFAAILDMSPLESLHYTPGQILMDSVKPRHHGVKPVEANLRQSTLEALNVIMQQAHNKKAQVLKAPTQAPEFRL